MEMKEKKTYNVVVREGYNGYEGESKNITCEDIFCFESKKEAYAKFEEIKKNKTEPAREGNQYYDMYLQDIDCEELEYYHYRFTFEHLYGRLVFNYTRRINNTETTLWSVFVYGKYSTDELEPNDEDDGGFSLVTEITKEDLEKLTEKECEKLLYKEIDSRMSCCNSDRVEKSIEDFLADFYDYKIICR